jgi:hypothetical protein
VADALVTVYRKSANGRIEAIDVKPDEAEFAVSRWPFAWSRTPDPKSFARWPWPPDRNRGDPVEPPSLADTAQPRAQRTWDLAK